MDSIRKGDSVDGYSLDSLEAFVSIKEHVIQVTPKIYS